MIRTKNFSLISIIEKYCCNPDLATYDPYDMWKTYGGFHVKNFYNRHRFMGMLPAAALTLYDVFVNNRDRRFYSKQEYPIVRALAALSLLNLSRRYPHRCQSFLDIARRHLNWLLSHSCQGYSGYCWGLGFRYAVAKDLIYDQNTPFSTMTPYALEAFIEYGLQTDDHTYDEAVRSIYHFFDRDILVMYEDDELMATSYVPLTDRIVINAVSYTMYALCLSIPFCPEERQIAVINKIRKLSSFVIKNQNSDGSWLYSPEGRSFVDCFHSCIIIKNLIKANRAVPIEGVTSVIEKGYHYIKTAFYDKKSGLFRRFTITNKPSIVRYDLYDNAEVLNLAFLMQDDATVRDCIRSIQQHFCRGGDIYSQIDRFGHLVNKNTLRWAVMPYMYALSQIA